MIDINNVNILLENRFEELTEAQIEFLVENRITFIKNANKDKISTAHDPKSAKLNSDKIVDKISETMDPTGNKTHTQWLVNRYKAGDFKLGDHRSIRRSVESFEASKKHLENGDLNSYKSIDHLNDALAPVQSRVAEANSDTNKVQDMPEIFNEDGLVGYKVPNKTTSIKNYGPVGKLARTRWCTAASGSANMFSGYKGGKYTLHTPEGNVLQAHHQSNQLKDISNKEIDLKKDVRFAKHREGIEKFLSVTHKLEGSPGSNLVKFTPVGSGVIQHLLDTHQSVVDSLERYAAQNGGKVPWDAGSRLKDSETNLTDSLKNAQVTDDQFEKLKSIKTVKSRYDDTAINKDLTIALAHSPHTKPQHLKHIASSISVDDDRDIEHDDALNSLVKHTNHSPESHHAVIDKVLSLPKVRDRDNFSIALARHGSDLLPEHFKRIEHIAGVKEAALGNNASDPPASYFDDMKDEVNIQGIIAAHDKIPEHIANHLLQHSTDKFVLGTLASNQNVPLHIAALAAIKGSAVNVRNLIEHRDSKPDDVSSIASRALDGTIAAHSNQWVESVALHRGMIDHMVSHPGIMEHVSGHGTSFTNNPRIKSTDLEKLIYHPSFNMESHIDAILKSHATTPKVIDKLIEKVGVDNRVASSLLEKTESENVTAGHLHAILGSKDVLINNKHKVMFHPSVQLSHFEKMKDDPRMHGAISNSKNAPPSILHSLATSPMDHVRLNVANNPNTEARTRDILKTDSVPEIAKKAK